MIYISRAVSSKVFLPSLLIVMAFMTYVVQTQAKRSPPPGMSYIDAGDMKMRRGGCSNFGHSCFGGHGKRATPVNNVGYPEELPVVEERPNEAGSFFTGDGSQPRLEIFSRGEGQLDARDLDLYLQRQFHKPEYIHLTPFLRNWLRSAYQREDVGADE